MLKILLPAILLTAIFSIYILMPENSDDQNQPQNITTAVKSGLNSVTTPNPATSIVDIPSAKTIVNDYHIFQSFNNCGPAALSMALSYYGINKSQSVLGEELRPYQVAGGDNDDKSVTLEEVGQKAKDYNLTPYLRPMGDYDKIKKFISIGIPVITRTYLNDVEDIGHYRVVKGYDDTGIIQDDSLQGKNLHYTYNEFSNLWDKFGREYLVLVPADKKQIAESILGGDSDEEVAWHKAATHWERVLIQLPENVQAGFNLSVAYYKLGDYQKSVKEFEKVENQLSFRTLWYQIEPILAYYELGNYSRVIEISDRILNNHNRAFSELYILRGKVYQSRGENEMARQEFERAVHYNKNLKSAQEALKSL